MTKNLRKYPLIRERLERAARLVAKRKAKHGEERKEM